MDENGEGDMEIVECGGTSMVDCRVCFDHSNKYLFCTAGKVVRVIDVETGERVQALDHTGDVVGIFVDEENTSRVFTCTSAGVISHWNFEDGTLAKEWTIEGDLKVRTFIIPKFDQSVWYVVVGGGKNTTLHAISRTRKGLLSDQLIEKVVDDQRKLSIHSRGHFVCWSVGRKIWIRDLKNSSKSARLLGKAEKNINLVVCHPTKDSVAIGDALGRINIWHKVLGQRPVYSVYHWHSLPVSDIAFSSEGTTMYSGGQENVVVRWSFQSSSKEETKDFLPRTGAKIRFLSTSPDSSLVAVSLEDNCIEIASSQLKILNSIKGFIRNADEPIKEKGKEKTLGDGRLFFPIGLIYNNSGGEAMKGALITNGRPGYLQFYDPKKDKQRMQLDVIGKNQPPAERGRQLSYFEVAQMAMSDVWLATIDHRSDIQYSDETNLKFWKYDEESKSFKLTTWVDRPHSGIVTSLFFRPSCGGTASQFSLLSTGDDGKFKIWELSTDTNIYQSSEIWTCERIGYYRGQPALCGDFSSDGALGIGFGHTATVWDFEEHRMTTAISVLSNDASIRKLQFGVSSDEKQLVAIVSDQNLAVWDTLSQLCLWRVATRPDVICKDLASGLFAAFFGSKICLFHLSSPKPTRVATSTKFRRAVSATFASDYESVEKENNGNEASRLYFITDNQKMMCFQKDLKEQENIAKAVAPPPARNAFAELLEASKATQKKNSSSARLSMYETNMQLLSGATHTLPAVATIGPRFAESCLTKKESKENDDQTIFPDLASELTFASLKATYFR